MSIDNNLAQITSALPAACTLVAVSKYKPNEAIIEAYESGCKDFGESKVQELSQKAEVLPKDIRWHMIGHLQRNKVKYITPFVHLIHGVDSLRLLQEINKQAAKNERTVQCLLQMHIAQEDTKFGLSLEEANDIIARLDDLPHVKIMGLMGMATHTEDTEQVRREFATLKGLFETYKNQERENLQMRHLSMGMSGDYLLAVEEGSNMVRIGSAIFGTR